MADRLTQPDKDRKSFADRVAEKLIDALEKGTAPWQKPWSAGAADFLPHNPTTGKRYRGINALMLAAQGRDDTRWMTYKQAQGQGAQVRKGERGTPVQYWQYADRQERRDDQGKPVLDPATGKPVMDEVRLERPKVFTAIVFNAEQIDGLPPPAERPPVAWNPIEKAEAILAASGADIRHSHQGSAFYAPGRDFIQLPHKEHFGEAAGYYATALHELGHWTGHPSRLERDLAHPFGSEGYAKEELRAEIASLILGNDLGIGHDPGQHAAYVKSWIKVLQDDPLEIFRAATDAEKIATYVVGLEQRQEQQQSVSFGIDRPIPDDGQQYYARVLSPNDPGGQTTSFHWVEGRSSWKTQDEAVEAFNSHVHSPVHNHLTSDEALKNALVNTGEGWSLPVGNGIMCGVAVNPGATVREAVADLEAAEGVSAPDRVELWTGAAPQKTDLTAGPILDGDVFIPRERVLIAPLAQSQELSTEAVGRDQAKQPAQAVPVVVNLSPRPPRLSPTPDAGTGYATVDRAWSRWEATRHGRLAHEAQADAFEAVRSTPALLAVMDPAKALPLVVAAAAGALTAHDDGDARAPAVLDALAAWNMRNADVTEGNLSQLAEAAKSDGDRSRRMAEGLDVLQSSQIGVEAARVNEVRQREQSQELNPAATVEDRAAVRTERRDAEDRAALTAERETQAERQQTSDRTRAAQDGDSQALARTYISVPFKEKNEAKELGAKWDRQKQSWYVPPSVDKNRFAKWTKPAQAAEAAPRDAAPRVTASKPERVYLAVPYEHRAEAKQLGALWDKGAKSWYAPPTAQLAQLAKWLPENVERQQAPALDPRDEFAQVLKDLDMEVHGDHPIADGKTHRVRLNTDKGKETSGFYVLHLDEGRPAGYAKNNRTGDETRWKAKGYHLDSAERSQLAAQAAETQRRRAQELDRQYERVAVETETRLIGLTPVPAGEQTPYLAQKQVAASPGVYRDGDATVVPAIDVTGKVWTAQTIGDPALGGGTVKSFAKGGKKSGSFHPLGGLSEIAKAPAIIIAEGYATAASLRDGAGCTTVCAFDAGNMPAVAKALAERFPDKPIILAADENSIGRDGKLVTVGRDKAQEAADAVGGTVMLPVFRGATNGSKGRTDFNDMANEDSHGREAVARSVKAAVQIAHKRRAEQTQQQTQQQDQDLRQGRALEAVGQAYTQRLSRSHR